MAVWEFAWADSTLVVLDEWLSYRGGRLNRFDCSKNVADTTFKDFYFCSKLCSKTNSSALISNMTIVFSNSSSKMCKSGIFGPKFKDFYFCSNICNKASSRVLISNMIMVFQNSCPKHPNKACLVPDLRLFIFALNFAFSKIQGYFKYDNSSFFQISA